MVIAVDWNQFNSVSNPVLIETFEKYGCIINQLKVSRSLKRNFLFITCLYFANHFMYSCTHPSSRMMWNGNVRAIIIYTHAYIYYMIYTHIHILYNVYTVGLWIIYAIYIIHMQIRAIYIYIKQPQATNILDFIPIIEDYV